jgi:hypothetical protein
MGCGGIRNQQDDPGLFDLPVRPVDADRLDMIGRFADTGRIDEPEFDPAQMDAILNAVARGAGNIGYNGFLLLQQGIQQCRFSNIGLAGNGHRERLI